MPYFFTALCCVGSPQSAFASDTVACSQSDSAGQVQSIESDKTSRVEMQPCPLTAHDSASDAQASKAISPLQNSSTEAVVNEELPVKYWGNSFSLKFHRPSCAFARAMNARHVVFFHFRRQAIESGQRPCRYCLPPFIKRVECKLLPRERANGSAQPVNEPQSGSAVKEPL